MKTTVKPRREVVVDDHPVVRDGLRGVLAGEPDIDVVGEAAHGAEALARVAANPVDVVLMGLRMPTMGGVEAIRELRRLAPAVRVLVLTTFDADRDVLPAIEAAPPVTWYRRGLLPQRRRRMTKHQR